VSIRQFLSLFSDRLHPIQLRPGCLYLDWSGANSYGRKQYCSSLRYCCCQHQPPHHHIEECEWDDFIIPFPALDPGSQRVEVEEALVMRRHSTLWMLWLGQILLIVLIFCSCLPECAQQAGEDVHGRFFLQAIGCVVTHGALSLSQGHALSLSLSIFWKTFGACVPSVCKLYM
jgi:hypothetical protein